MESTWSVLFWHMQGKTREVAENTTEDKNIFFVLQRRKVWMINYPGALFATEYFDLDMGINYEKLYLELKHFTQWYCER